MNLPLVQGTLRQFGVEFVLTQTLQHQSQMFCVLFRCPWVYQDVIEKDLYKLVRVFLEQPVH